MRRRLFVAVALAGAVALVWKLWPRHQSDEDQIRALVADVARKAGEKDVSGVMEHVSEGYRGEGGDKRELKAMLLGYLLRSGVVAVLPSRLEFTRPPAGDQAAISFVVALARTPAQNAADLPADQLLGSHQIAAELTREDGTWRVTRAERRQAGLEDWVK